MSVYFIRLNKVLILHVNRNAKLGDVYVSDRQECFIYAGRWFCRLRREETISQNRPKRAEYGNHDVHTCNTPNLPTKIVDFRGFDSSIVLIQRGGIPRPIGDFPESLTQAMLVGCNVSRGIGRA